MMIPPQNSMFEKSGRTSSQPWMNRIYVIDDHPFFAAALSSLINTEADLSVCGVGSETRLVASDLVRLGPDLLVMDVHLSAKMNWAMAIEVRKWSQFVPMLFVSSLQNPRAESGLRWLDPCCFVEKTKDPVEIIHAIRKTLQQFRQLHGTATPPPKIITKK